MFEYDYFDGDHFITFDIIEVDEDNGKITLAISKDGKRLLSKKDLDGFMRFASDEAKKLAEKNARSACVEDNIVYGWAIHYFEENSIEGTLYNEDGTEYKPAVKTITKTEVKKVLCRFCKAIWTTL